MAIQYDTALCHQMPYPKLPIFCHATLRYLTLLYGTLRYLTVLYATLRYLMLPYATLRYFKSFLCNVVSPRQYCLNV